MTAPVAARARLSASRLAVAAGAAGLGSVGLAEILERAELQTRIDRKYVVPAELFQTLLDRLTAPPRVLEIDGRRAFGYESVYFDTPDLRSYRDHLQGQRHRFKVRTRTYLESADCLLEVKFTSGRSETIKHRMPYDLDTPTELRRWHGGSSRTGCAARRTSSSCGRRCAPRTGVARCSIRSATPGSPATSTWATTVPAGGCQARPTTCS